MENDSKRIICKEEKSREITSTKVADSQNFLKIFGDVLNYSRLQYFVQSINGLKWKVLMKFN